jgi:hypothetical protein
VFAVGWALASACTGTVSTTPGKSGSDAGDVDGSGSGGAGIDAGLSDGQGGQEGSVVLHLDSGTHDGGTLATSSKIDILIDIDNSASMGDKQDFLKAAIPDLINSLINPSCVNSTGAVVGVSSNGVCATGSLSFAPVHDMHIGIITSALGARGGDVCNPAAMAQAPFSNLSAHNDDSAHLINRSLTYASSGVSATEGTVPDLAPTPKDEFIYWFPGGAGMTAGAGTPITDSTQLVRDVEQVVGGAGVYGCGIESQLESWYRFLVQPDPYQTISVGTGVGSMAQWVGVDATIIQQRHDFLRPDSLVSIIVLSDENDSEIDVRSLGGAGYNWMSASFDPPRGTTACATTPGSASCQSCAQGTNATTDANCRMGAYSAYYDWGYDMNLRHVHMRQKYGVVPQFPIERYHNGLTSTTVPDRAGEYPPSAGGYVGMNDCTNPLFAASLPDGSATDGPTLCNLTVGTRPANFVFYTHIGGVPSSLLHYAPGDVNGSTLTSADWVKILGNDPLNYDYSGIDPHMIEDYQPRSGIPGPGSTTADPISGHDWITNTSNGMPGNATTGGHILAVDRQYACVFPLVDQQGNPAPRDCTQTQNANLCDCPHATGGLTAQELPPICDQTTPTKQVGAKAYPTVRELLLAKLMGTQGIVASICPEHVSEQTPGDPRYGYRPAIGILVSRLTPVIARPPM